jgi:hypothetical protein
MQRPKIVIEVGGGLVTNVYADAAVDIAVVDWDNIRAGDEPPEAMRFSDGSAVRLLMSRDNQII